MSVELPLCDVIMKGGITSGVIYPLALKRLSEHYRFKSLGGTSAGAIGAALGAAAEFNRDGDGFDTLVQKADDLEGGKLAALFQPQHGTRRLLPIMIAGAGFNQNGEKRAGRTALAVVRSVLAQYLLITSIGIIAVVVGVWLGLAGGIALGILLGLVLLLGTMAVLTGALLRDVTKALPANVFGICGGLGADGKEGFTDWLARAINECAGRAASDAPLTFGDLWGADTHATRLTESERRVIASDYELDATRRNLDLRMVTTCLSQGQPYELPFNGKGLFYSVAEWEQLFPKPVMDWLAIAHPARPLDPTEHVSEWEVEESDAAELGMRRLPLSTELPVIVATRLSLSFPALISAVPLHEIVRGSPTRRFRKLLFTDGGLCSNFPLHLFDEALPTRRTFAINLGRFAEDSDRSPDESRNIKLAKSNAPLRPVHHPIAEEGLSALTDFARRALDTTRNWSDNSYLRMPGFRDRIVRVLQDSEEGGLNMYMQTEVVRRLGDRGEASAQALIDQFEFDHYGDWTGWENHQWVRYRSAIASLRPFVKSYVEGRAAMADLTTPHRSYPMPLNGVALSKKVDAAIHALHAAFEDSDAVTAATTVSGAPKPIGQLRRTSGIT
jgi:predicted acylesterase/phospholipase RssA